MQVLPITTNLPNNISSKGYVGSKVENLTKGMSERCLNSAKSGRYKELPIINTFLFASERINNVFLNLSTIMERFCNACELTFEKSEKSGKHRFFIENKYSNYKVMCGDIEFSPEMNKLRDIDELENLESRLLKINPYKENSNFIIQRFSETKNESYDDFFAPDRDYIFIEEKLAGKEPLPVATMEDIEKFIEAAKKDGIV